MKMMALSTLFGLSATAAQPVVGDWMIRRKAELTLKAPDS